MYENEIYSESGVQGRTADTDHAAAPAADGYSTYQTDSTLFGAAEKAESSNAAKPRKKEKAPRKKRGIFRKVMISISLGLSFGLFAGLGLYAMQLATAQFGFFGSQLENYEKWVEEKWDQRDAEEASGDSITVIQPSSTPASVSTKIVQVDASEMVKQVMPAMVSIVNNYTIYSSYWGQTYSEKEAASGSGIIVAQNDEALLIVTNNHVVEDTDELVVTFIDGSEAEAVIKGLDEDMDLAVIAVPLSSLSQETKDVIAIAALGDSDALELGEPVFAIGNALGYGQSVSGGWISALSRELTFEDGSKGTFIQTDAAINPGNSGGALLNLSGEVIGINSSKIGGTYVEGMGYAIPITAASPIITDLMERETRTVKVEESKRGYMGIQLQSVTDDAANRYNMPKGVFVYSVEPGLAADKAGIKRGDIIVGFDGQKISSEDDLLGTIQFYRAGETIVVTIKRLEDSEYVTYELEVTLGVRE